ncbi:MAG: PAS domain-containing protein, partial [Thermoguttaceae bacterium]
MPNTSGASKHNTASPPRSMFQFFFDELLEGVEVFRDNHLVFANKTACNMFRYEYEEVLGHTPFEVVNWKNRLSENSKSVITLEKISRFFEAADTGLSQNFETEYCVDNNFLFFERYLHAEEWEGKKLFFLKSVDKTKLLRVEEDEQVLNDIFNGIQDGLMIVDKNLLVHRVNKQLHEQIPELQPGRLTCYESIVGIDEPCDFCPCLKTFKDGQKHVYNYYNPNLKLWYELSTFPIHDRRTGEITRAIEFIRNINEQQLQQIALQQREKLFEAILNTSRDGIFATSGPGSNKHTNPRFVSIFGEQAESFKSDDAELVCAVCRDVLVNPEVFINAITKLRDTQTHQDAFLEFKDGRRYEWHGISVKTGLGPDGYTRIWKFHDVTEKYNSDQIIKQSEERYRTLFSSLASSFILLDIVRDEADNPVNYRVSEVNPMFLEKVPYPKEMIVGSMLLDIFKRVQVLSEDYGDKWWTGIDKTAITGEPGVYHLYAPEAAPNVYQEASVFRSGYNQIGIILNDETLRVQSEKSLKTMRLVIDHISLPVLWLSLEGKIIYTNLETKDVLGIKPSETLIGQFIWEYDKNFESAYWPDFCSKVINRKTLKFETHMI